MEIMFYQNVYSTPLNKLRRFRFNSLADLYVEFNRIGIPSLSDKLSNTLFSANEYKQDNDIIVTKKMNTRIKANVLKYHLAIIDFDEGTKADLEEIERRISGFRYIKYTSFRNNYEKGKIKVRFILELEHSIPANQWKAFNLLFDFTYTNNMNDDACKSISQAFFMPAHNLAENTFCTMSYHDGGTVPVMEGFRKEDEENELTELALMDFEQSETVNVHKEELISLCDRLDNHIVESNRMVATPLRELIETGNFDETHLGNHNGLLKMSSTIGRAFPDMDMSSLYPLFEKSQEDKSNNYDEEELIRTITYGFSQGAKYKVFQERKKEELAISNVKNISEDILERCGDMDIAPSDFYKYLIIVVAKHYYIYHPKKQQYVKYTKDHTLVAIKKLLDGVNICGSHGVVSMFEKIESPKGATFRPKGLDQLIEQHGLVCRDVKGFMDSSFKREFFHPETEIFHEQIMRRRDIKPKFNQNVDTWLRSLGDYDDETYYDLCTWIKYGLNLDEQLSILYFSGPAGTGKSMFPHIMARNWTVYGVTPAQNVLGQTHNAQIKDCPIVLADEALPSNVNFGGIADVLRDFVSKELHTLRLMHTDGFKIKGYLRLILSANNPNILSIDGNQTMNDIKAISDRFFYLNVSQKAADFINKLNDDNWGEVSTWKGEDVAIAHFIWLEQNIKIIKKRTRFGISKGEDFVRKIIKTNTVGSDILSTVISYLSTDEVERESVYTSDDLFVDNYVCWANVDGLKKIWNKITDDKMPRAAAIASNLAMHSHEKMRHNREGGKGRLVFPIKTTELIEYAIRTNYGDPETILRGLGYMQDTLESTKELILQQIEDGE